MPKVLVLYYSAYGHIETMANAVAEGARGAGASVDIKRVPELVPPDVAKASYFKVDQAAPVDSVRPPSRHHDHLPCCDGRTDDTRDLPLRQRRQPD